MRQIINHFYCETCKLSEDKGKYSGDPATVRRFMKAIHMHP